LKGHLHLTCALDGSGRSALREQSFRAPFHLSKPHEDAGALVVNVVNPTAGIFDGDELEMIATVEAGAQLVLTSPSASRIYQSRSGRPALVRQVVRAAAGSRVEFLPEPLIPHAGSIYQQHTELLAESGAEMLFFEWLSPGRVAGGEVFQYARLDWRTDVRIGGKLAARERYTLEPARPETLTALTARFPQANYLGCFWVSQLPLPVEAVEALNGEGIYLGWSPLAHGAWTIKTLCADALTTRKLLTQLRRILYAAMDRVPPALGRF
jgi:urease accessory protein